MFVIYASLKATHLTKTKNFSRRIKTSIAAKETLHDITETHRQRLSLPTPVNKYI